MAYEAPTITEVGQFADVTLGGGPNPKEPWNHLSGPTGGHGHHG